MVLEEAVNSSADAPFVPDATPSSDSDPYLSNPSNRATLHIDLRDYPHPPPIIGSLLGHSRQRQAAMVDRGIAAQSQLLKRPPTQDEAEAMAYNICYSETSVFWGSALGLAFGLFLANRGRAVFRFPFMTPNREWFNPDKFGPLQGQGARAAWHVARGVLYGTSGYGLGSVVASSYGAVHFATAARTDERLKDFNRAMDEYARARAGGLSRAQRPVPQPQPTVTTKQDGWDDNMSPQSGNFEGGDSGVLSDSQMHSQRRPGPVDSTWNPSDERDSPFGKDSTPRQSRNFGSDYDDASPAAATPQSSPTESAWDRIRRDAVSGRNSSSQPDSNRWSSDRRATESQQRGSSTQSDSFAFSTSEERQLAKAEAQKDFDKRVERERQGKDFNDTRTKW